MAIHRIGSKSNRANTENRPGLITEKIDHEAIQPAKPANRPKSPAGLPLLLADHNGNSVKPNRPGFI
jgi:hypothetical protein